MHYVTERIFNLGTYGLAGFGIIMNLETIKGVILFIGALVLLVLQIYLHIIKIRNAKKNGEE